MSSSTGWVPYEQRRAWLSEVDVGVSAHFDNLETHFAFRTRLLDYLWAGLPIATTGGDVLGDLVEQEGLGASLPAEDVAAWVAALGTLLDDGIRRAASERVAARRQRFEWRQVGQPLERLVVEPGRRIALPRRARLAGVRELPRRADLGDASRRRRHADSRAGAASQRRVGRLAQLP